jgi:hypothetical protein
MGTTSSFFGGGGGGGDPQANFQASANVTSGDLVVLNNNGTVEPVTSVAYAADFTKSNNGTKIVADGTPNFSQTGKWGIYNSTQDKYLFAVKRDSGSNADIYQATYSEATEEFTLTFRGQIVSNANMMARKFSPNQGVMYAWRKTNGYMYVRSFYWSGTSYSLSNDSYCGSTGISSQVAYINPNGEGSSSFAVGGLTNNYVSITHGTHSGDSSSPSMSHQMESTDRRWDAGGSNWSSNSLVGRHVKDDVHVFVGDEANSLSVFACRVESNATTYGAKNQLSVPVGSAYKSFEYDTDTNIGVFTYYSSGSKTKAKAISVNPTTLVTTTYDLNLEIEGSSATVGYNPTAKIWQVLGSNQSKVHYFTLSSDGTQGVVSSTNFHPATSPFYAEHGCLFPAASSSMVAIFNSGSNPTSAYVDTANHTYATQYEIPYTNTNVDTYFGEAKEAITSGSAGPIAMLNRSIDIADSSFQKGQKLFANPSGTSLATSGTYRVGYASDADTVIVTGDPS